MLKLHYSRFIQFESREVIFKNVLETAGVPKTASFSCSQWILSLIFEHLSNLFRLYNIPLPRFTGIFF